MRMHEDWICQMSLGSNHCACPHPGLLNWRKKATMTGKAVPMEDVTPSDALFRTAAVVRRLTADLRV